MKRFKLVGDCRQRETSPEAIEKIAGNIFQGVAHSAARRDRLGQDLYHGERHEKVNRPTLVISHNKTYLAAQLYAEFKTLFPDNEVTSSLAITTTTSPRLTIPSTDTFIEKDSSINEEIDGMRLMATNALFERGGHHHRCQRFLHTASARPRRTTGCSSPSRKGR